MTRMVRGGREADDQKFSLCASDCGGEHLVFSAGGLGGAFQPPAQQQRLSIAFFLGAQLDAVVPVYTLPPELAREARGPDSDPHNPLLRDVGWNYLKGRLRSHPDVAERYYQDVFRERAEQLIV